MAKRVRWRWFNGKIKKLNKNGISGGHLKFIWLRKSYHITVVAWGKPYGVSVWGMHLLYTETKSYDFFLLLIFLLILIYKTNRRLRRRNFYLALTLIHILHEL